MKVVPCLASVVARTWDVSVYERGGCRFRRFARVILTFATPRSSHFPQRVLECPVWLSPEVFDSQDC